jgi:hypothetical protein
MNVRFSVPGDVGLDIERAVAFVDALLRQASLAPSVGIPRIVYHPKYVESLWSFTRVHDRSAVAFRTRWEQALRWKFYDDSSSATIGQVYRSKVRTYDLALVPGWALDYDQVAVYMLPAMVWSILGKLDLSDVADIDAVRRCTEQAFPALSSRDVWNAHAWVVALEPQISLKDLAYASHPPSAAYELE